MGDERQAAQAGRELRVVRFASFELDVRAGELRNDGAKIRLQEQPFQVLLMLLERPGEVVLREEIRKKLWPNDTIVEFAPSINAAIQRLRDALGDSAENPQYVETVARRGYRFIGELLPEQPATEPGQASPDESSPDASDLTGHTLSHYRVYEKLGRGGMGEVYRARDTKLGREVALKVLPEEFARDADRMARFEREAQVLASLNHPNIAAIYGLEEASGIRALVMELVEGPTLAERIARGAIPVEESLRLAQQIADALETAHEKAIVHRDLKPANVKVTPQGTVKVLDFGLATVMQCAHAVPEDPENSPTQTATLSQAGVILGTAAYMAPEQARGEAVDKRADIWAFGVVLYEMLTGQQAFCGKTITDVLAAVVTKDPEWDRVPAKVRRLLQLCLQKDPKQRLQAVGDWRVPLEALQVGDLHHGRKLMWGMAGMLVISILVSVVLYFHPSGEQPQVLRFSVNVPDKATLLSPPAVSPDGRRLAFVARTGTKIELWVRDLDSLSARPLPGTEQAMFPFWSPDSHSIGFFAENKLKKTSLAGGLPASVAEVPFGRHDGSWSKNDVIVFSAGGDRPLLRVSATGGNVTPATKLDPELKEVGHNSPWFLPDGRHFLYAAVKRDREATVYVGDVNDPSRRHTVLQESSPAVFVQPGYLVFIRAGTLVAQLFESEKAQVAGDPFPIAEISSAGSYYLNPVGWFGVSQNGVLAYTSGAIIKSQLTWFDRAGKSVGTIGTPEVMQWPEVSPDGNSVAVDRLDPRLGFYDIWIHDLKRGTSSRVTFNSKDNISPEWSPDGNHLAFTSNQDGILYQTSISGSNQEEILDDTKRSKVALDWSRDGRYIIEQVAKETGPDIWLKPLFGDRRPFPYFQSEFNKETAKLSPNTRWLAYSSDETKRYEIYVESFPAHGGKRQVSTDGGSLPTWSADGKELFFLGADGKLMAVDVTAEETFEAGAPKPLFEPHAGFQNWFTVSRDGRFLIPVPVEPTSSPTINVVMNWTAGLKK